MARRPDRILAARYRAAIPAPKSTIYSGWRVGPGGNVTRCPMPAFTCKRMPEGFAVWGSPEDIENERIARKKAAPVSPATVAGPPSVMRIRPGPTPLK